MTEAPEPGWYDDPGGSPALRYWDGSTWTSRLRQRSAPQSSEPQAHPVAEQSDDEPPTDELPRVVAPVATEPEPDPEPEPEPEPEPPSGLDALLTPSAGPLDYSAPEPARVPAPEGAPAFLPVQRLAQVLIILLGLAGLLALAGLVIGAQRHARFGELQRRPVPPEVLESSDNAYGAVGAFQLIVAAAIAIVFLVWFFRVYANLAALGARQLRHGPGWAVGAWLVPVVNLARPLEMVSDAWRASNPKAPGDQGATWREANVPRFLGVWWGLLLGTTLLARLASWKGAADAALPQLQAAARSAALPTVLDEVSHGQRNAVAIGIAADIFAVVLVLATVVLVQALTERQLRRARRLGKA